MFRLQPAWRALNLLVCFSIILGAVPPVAHADANQRPPSSTDQALAGASGNPKSDGTGRSDLPIDQADSNGPVYLPVLPLVQQSAGRDKPPTANHPPASREFVPNLQSAIPITNEVMNTIGGANVVYLPVVLRNHK